MSFYARLSSGLSNKNMTKQNVLRNKIFNHRLTTKRGIMLALSVMFALSAVVPVVKVRADAYQAQIDALNAQNSQSRGALNDLQMQAASYQDAIANLQNQIAGLQAAIADNEAKQADLQAQIGAAQAKLDQQRAGLSQDLKAMYVGGQMTTVEMLATSKNLSDYIDAQMYSSAVQSKIQATLAEITSLQNQLKAQKAQVEQLLAEQQQQQASLAAAESEQQRLLAMNEGQQAAYNQQIRSNNAKIAELRAQQLAANQALRGQVVAGDPGHGGYPSRWDSPVAQDSVLDSWGMFNRECVSYAAWKVYQTYGHMPYWGGSGNANQWPSNARAAGVPTGSTPRAHSVAISMHGYYGHAMWVEAVNGNTIYVSQYNYDLAGHYSEMQVDGSNFIYIYFN